MVSTPSVVAQELAEVRDLKALAEECGWDDNSKEYKDRMASINKKYKALMKMGSMTVSMQGGSSSAKQTKQNFIWVDSATRDAGDLEEAVKLLPEVFGEGKYGTSGVFSRGGKQKFKEEECVWKRVSKDGKHYRIIQHSTGYFYQKGFLPSDTAEGEDDEEDAEEEEQDRIEEQGGEEDEPPEKPTKPAKKGARHLLWLLYNCILMYLDVS
ncbi:hypothetical protein Ctob_015243 [Chrysochromulina tobinii]|uniref:Uncharacterized protein n=1 Tax=Chrysochromulina tobinii TaxID=1460289 RepID=A0A0M0KAZ6_9EUKA|nr:hypothetical protein Ctob_015243 [Chrysochromulina tobinii]|eukprot:KOO35593.1 hypothetical protein Ctob_015243 [Chrysochromulina sp. CCMP291]